MKKYFSQNKPVFVRSKRVVVQTLLPSVLVAASVLSFQTTFASSTTISKNAPDTYIVKKGDTLWGIAGKFLNKPWQWPKIWVKNSQIKNPHLIYPGDRLLLCLSNNATLIGKDEGTGCAGIVSRYNNPNEVRLSPRVRVESEGEAVQLIPLKNIKTWLKQSQILPEEQIRQLPHVIGVEDSRLIAGKGQKVYISGQNVTIGQSYSVYKKLAPYILGKGTRDEHYAGTELIKIASGIITHSKDDISTLELTESFDKEVTRDDLILPQQNIDLPSNFAPVPAKNIEGSIIRVLDSIGDATKNSVVTINQGTQQSVQAGQVFEIVQSAGTVKDKGKIKELPYEKVGELLIFRTFDQLSYGYILNSTIPIKIGSKVISPES